MNVLHLVSSIGPKAFGIGPVVINLMKEQNELDCRSDIWCNDTDECLLDISEEENINFKLVRGFPLLGPQFLYFSPYIKMAALSEAGSAFDIVHQHVIWTGVSRVSMLLRYSTSCPTVISPHGSLEPWAINRSKLKKHLASVLYENKNLRSASCLHACSSQEVVGFREFGLTNPVAVIPNGIGMSWIQSAGNGLAFRKQFGIPESKRILLYLSRITPIKGLPMLMQALGIIKVQLKDWIIIIAGADEFDHLKVVSHAVSEAGLQDSVLFTGMLVGQMKRDAFAAADIFVLPTLRENFAIAVAEALGAGVPVITTKGAPWQDLVTHDCGWWTDVSADALAVALQEAIQKTPDELKAMGERGRTLVSQNYTWKQAAYMTIQLYEWLLGKRDRPEFVITT